MTNTGESIICAYDLNSTLSLCLTQTQSFMKIIPQELLVNILCRLPAKCIGRYRCVSKLWLNLLSELSFIKDHLNRTKQLMGNESLILILDISHTLCSASITLNSLGEVAGLATELSFVVNPDFYTEGLPSCDGLILIQDNTDKSLLANPTTKKVRELPVSPDAIDPRASFTMYGVGYDQVNNDYKVVTLSYYYNTDNEYEPYCEEMFVNVYSVRNGTWKQVERSPYDHAMGHLTSGVFVGGRIHWLATSASDHSSVIAGFDLTEEKFHEIPPPSSIDGERFVFNRLAVLGGCLCMSPTSSEKETDVWVMEYGVEQSWTKISIVDDKASEFRPLLCTPGQLEVVMVKDEETVDEKLVMYNLDSGAFKDISMQDFSEEFYVAGSFMETLVSPYYNHET